MTHSHIDQLDQEISDVERKFRTCQRKRGIVLIALISAIFVMGWSMLYPPFGLKYPPFAGGMHDQWLERERLLIKVNVASVAVFIILVLFVGRLNRQLRELKWQQDDLRTVSKK
ncbi:hypothetical protein [Roseovarius sp. EL26]|uniref:hypothetical protein n=1 Tax=Roseovarius sp. EL26 TaxID=2126672 RepID=UPI000EA2C45D|nr:hypothetical protein [Roseovarius sp. EL26]